MVEIPLFPLGSVLFPHMPLALHIFEERYQVMMRDCESSGQSFGIVAIKSGFETARGAHPYNVGTLANLKEVERLDDGRYNLMITGAARFRISELTLDRPYLTANIEFLTEVDDANEALAPLAARVATVFARYVGALQTIAGRSTDGIETPDDPEMLSYLVAGTLQVETWQKQLLLETDSAAARLRQCLRLLRREIVFADRMLTRRDPRLATTTLTPN